MSSKNLFWPIWPTTLILLTPYSVHTFWALPHPPIAFLSHSLALSLPLPHSQTDSLSHSLSQSHTLSTTLSPNHPLTHPLTPTLSHLVALFPISLKTSFTHFLTYLLDFPFALCLCVPLFFTFIFNFFNFHISLFKLLDSFTSAF